MTETASQSANSSRSLHNTPMRRRVRSIQPDFTDDMLDARQEAVTSLHTLNDLRAVIAHWCMQQNDLPDGFADTFSVTSVARQVVPAIVVRVQRASRELTSTLIAFDGTPISQRRFDPRNLFALSEISNRCEFPTTAERKVELISGNESLEVCDDCHGAGENLCGKCEGTGTLNCAACSGGGQVACANCRGQGVILVGGTETRSCPRCSGRRTEACPSCSGKGSNNCPVCQGGTIKCKTCAASGKMRQQWTLVTLTRTQVYHRLICRNGWVDDGHDVAVDGVLLRSREWPQPQQFSAVETQGLIPDCLSAAFRACLKSVDFSSSTSEQNTGMRLELRVSYVYHMETLHRKTLSDFFVSGCSNTVTPRKVARRQRGLLARFTDKHAVSPEEREHVRCVNAGEVFLTDTLGLSYELRRLGTLLQVSDTGYVVPADTNASSAEIQIHFEYDRASEPIIRTTIELGPADRHKFPEYMVTNQTLSIGALGLMERNNRAIERLVLVDSRFYSSMSFTAYHSVLRLMVNDAQQLIESNFNWKPEARKLVSRTLKQICSNVELNLQLISRDSSVSTRQGRGEALLTFRLSNGRTQTVLLTLRSVLGVSVVELKSRCRTVHGAATIRAALKHNLVSPCGGFALDVTSTPPTVDIVHRLVAIDGEPNYSELIHCLSSIVHHADAIEQKQSDQDQF
jgi:hypothetical protein